jgi:hypothetical protein
VSLARSMSFAAACAAALLLHPDPGRAFTRGTILPIIINDNHPQPIRPTTPVDNLRDLQIAFWRCWNPPPLDSKRQPLDLTFQVSFKRSGELFGKPRTIDFARPVTPEERELYYQAVAEAVERCSPMPFTESMGGASAGRPFRINLQDRRNSRKAEIPWLTTTTG